MKLYQEKIQWLKDQGYGEKYDAAGIYATYIENELVYIGKSTNMLERLGNHLAAIQTNKKTNKYKVLREATANGLVVRFDVLYYSSKKMKEAIEKDIGKQEAILIRKYMPPLNYQIPKIENYHSFDINKSAATITLQQIVKDKYFIF